MQTLSAEVAELGIRLGADQTEQLRRYYEEMIEWNARINLTSVTEWEDVQSRHFLDSLTVSLAIPPEMLDSGSFVDVGSGAGFPGIPLKIAFPGLKATLIDSTRKRTAFLHKLNEALALRDVDVRTGRAETLAHDADLRERFDFVLSRAVAPMAVLAELTLPFCRLGGIVVAQKGLGIEDELRRSLGAIETLGGVLADVREVATARLSGRCLVTLRKERPTPDRYPRRPGLPKKRPL